MLSDEEREALQYFNTETKTEAMHYGAVLVKLIEKQSKEIEELKEENEKYKNPPFFNEDNYTSNDKIKAKIEEYEKELNKLLQKEEWLEPHDTIKRNKYMHYIEFGQSLLEKE